MKHYKALILIGSCAWCMQGMHGAVVAERVAGSPGSPNAEILQGVKESLSKARAEIGGLVSKYCDPILAADMQKKVNQLREANAKIKNLEEKEEKAVAAEKRFEEGIVKLQKIMEEKTKQLKEKIEAIQSSDKSEEIKKHVDDSLKHVTAMSQEVADQFKELCAAAKT